MYDNIGGKIKGLAKALGIIFLVVGIIACLLFVSGVFDRMDEDEALIVGIASLVAGVLIYFSSWVLYGFGQHVEDTETIREVLVSEHIEKNKEK